MRLVPVALILVTACGSAPSATGAGSTVAVEPPGSVAGTVVQVLDGDSMVVSIAGDDVEVRLDGVNAPEPGECFADESRALLSAAATGSISVSERGRDQFGRTLAYVFRDGENLNQAMLAWGGALATAPGHELLPDFLAADEDAWSRGVGMWQPGVCRPATDSGVFLFEVEFDAPGRDDTNPNGEYVVVGNDGAAVDLGGWLLRDESSVHRFAFPAGTWLEAEGFVVVRSGCGTDGPGELHWCATGPVWNNEGDTALLIDGSGRIVSRLRYRGG